MAEYYKIGVEVALAGTIMQGLEAISSKLLGIKTRVKEVEGGFARWATAIGGAAAILGSDKIVEGLKKAVEAGGELVKQQTLLQNLLQNPMEVQKTTMAAQVATLKIMGTTIAENIAGMREMIGVTNTADEARALYLPTMRGAKVLEALTGKPADGSLQTLAKAIEQLGGGTNPQTQEVDPERFERYMREAVKTIVASGGLIDANALLGFAKQAGPMARMTQDPATLFQSYMTAIMDMGGYRAGTALTAAGRQLLGGKMGLSTAQEMQAMGLLIPGKWRKAGTGVKVDEGGLVGENLLKGTDADVAKWFNEVFKKALIAHGKSDPSDINQELYKVLGTETTRRIAGLFLQNSGQIQRDANLQKGAADVDTAYKNLEGGDLGMNIKNVESAWTNLMQAFGAPMVGPAIEGLQTLANAVNAIAGSALAHPELTRAIGEGLAGLAAGLAVFGGAAVVAAFAALAPGGAIAAGIAGLAAMVGVVAAMNWESFKRYAQDFAEGTAKINNALMSNIAFKTLADDMTKLPAALVAAMNGLVDVLTAAVMSIGSNIGPIASQAMDVVAKALADGIDSIPGKVMGAIGGMAAGVASAIGSALAGAFKGAGASVAPSQSPYWPATPKPQSYYAPPASRSAVHVQTAINLDGKAIARATSIHLASLNTHPRQAPYSDPALGYVSPDFGFSTG